MHKHFHKVIHPNRYLVWAIIISVIITMFVVSYAQLHSYAEESSGVFSELKTKRVYTNAGDKYMVSYPRTWDMDKESESSVVFLNPQNTSEDITVVTTIPSAENGIRRSLATATETKYERDGMNIGLITTKTAGGEPAMKVALIKSGDKLYYVYGKSAWFESFVNNFKVLP